MIGDMNIARETGMPLIVSAARAFSARWAVALLACVLLGSPAAARAVTPTPAWQLRAIATPTVFAAGDNSIGGGDSYKLVVTNVGGAPSDGTPVRITGTPPPGVTFGGPGDEMSEWSCTRGSDTSFTCEDPFGPVTAFGQPSALAVPVIVDPSVAADTVVSSTFTVSGGGAPSSSSTTVSTALNPSVSPAPFGIQDLFSNPADAAGAPETQAGGHPHSLSVGFNFSSEIWQLGEFFENAQAVEFARDIVVDLPVGFSGNPQAVPACPITALVKASGAGLGRESNCPLASQVGTVNINSRGLIDQSVRGGFNSETELIPVFNMVPEPGHPAELGTAFASFPVLMYPTVVGQGADAHLRITLPGLPSTVALAFQGTQLTLYGNPAAQAGGAAAAGAFFTNPSWCSGAPLTTTVYGDSYQHQGRREADGSPDLSDPAWVRASTSTAATSGCGALHFAPSMGVRVDSSQADEPTGLGVDLHIPQNSDVEGLATPALRDVRVVLPAGMSVSPGAADGLVGCSDGQFDVGSNDAVSCPSASQVGSVTARTPILAEPLTGQVFLGSPECSPCSNADAQGGRMLRLFLQLEGPGVVLKFPGTVSADAVSGRLTATFRDLIQQPVSDVQLQLKGGPRAAVANPQACGAATSMGDLTPWSAPDTPDGLVSSSFGVDWDGAGGGCPGVPPFAPGFSAGTVTPVAGAFSAFTLTFSRQDREGDLSGLTVHTPPGLLGVLKSVPLCGESQASQGSCGVESEIGTTQVAVGAGSHPFWVSGKVYLTGPYAGGPFGLSIVVPAVAGPFNLGTVLVRASIRVDSSTAALTVVSDPLPQIVSGVPLRVRAVNVTLDRPGFMFNPTSCEPQSIAASITDTQGTASEVASRFQVGSCAALGFSPRFTASSSAKTSRANGASLDVRVAYSSGQANIHRVAVKLPKQLPARLTTVQQACPAAVFEANPASCDAGSLVGVGTAISPILSVPLTGPAYLVSHGGAAFPDIVIVLQGQGITLNLVGNILISKSGVTSATFANVPDAPISSFDLNLPVGPHSALAAVGSLCAQTLTMPTTITAQDGAQIAQTTKITVKGCTKTKKKTKKHRKVKHKKARKSAAAHGKAR